MSAKPGDDVDPGVMARAALETLIFAPIGLGAMLVEDAPAAVRRVRQEISNARFIGRLTVEQGTARLRAGVSAPSSERPAVENHTEPHVDDALPIAGYDEMPAIEIVALLDSLTAAERCSVAEHEAAHRRRRTILGKLAQLEQ